jgi:tRNA(Ile)-lysidine synthase
MLDRFLLELSTLAGENALSKRYLVAVSGGADSMVTAALFHEAGIRFEIAHCNFHLRGTDSNRDMQLVEKTAAKWQVPCHIREFDTLSVQKNSGKSVEMVARELRYAWFSTLLADFDYLVTAHQSNDAAETQLLNLCRGTGLKGLCGIPPKNEKIIRPMLPFTAAEIRQYADNHHIEYAIDYTNEDELIVRNRIRHSVVPQLETINPQFLTTNVHSRFILQQQYAYYQKHIDDDIRKMVVEDEEAIRIDRSLLYQNDNTELVLYEFLSGFGFSANVSETIANNRHLQPGKQFFSESHILLVDRDCLIIQPRKEGIDEVVDVYSLDNLRQYFIVEKIEYQKDIVFEKNPGILYLPKEKLIFPMQIRAWQHGDFFFPLGGKGRQKLSDFFTDHKIDRFSKENIRLLCIGDQIAWVIGWRSDERFKVKQPGEIYTLKKLK